MNTLENLLADSLRRAADGLAAQPDVDAALQVGRRRLFRRRLAMGAGAVAALVAIPFAVQSLRPPTGETPPPLATAAPARTVTPAPSSAHVDLTADQLPMSSQGSPSPQTDPEAISVTWAGGGQGRGVLIALARFADGRSKTITADCTVPCAVKNASLPNYVLSIVPADAMDVRLVNDDASGGGPAAESSFYTTVSEVPIPGTSVAVTVHRFDEAASASIVSRVLYRTDDAVRDDRNRPLPSSTFADQGGASVFAWEQAKVLGVYDPKTGVQTWKLGDKLYSVAFSVGNTNNWDAIMAGLLPSDARDVTFNFAPGATRTKGQVDMSGTIAGEHAFLATGRVTDGDLLQSVTYTDSSGKRVMIKP